MGSGPPPQASPTPGHSTGGRGGEEKTVTQRQETISQPVRTWTCQEVGLQGSAQPTGLLPGAGSSSEQRGSSGSGAKRRTHRVIEQLVKSLQAASARGPGAARMPSRTTS